MDEKKFREILSEQNKEIGKTFDGKLKEGFDNYTNKVEKKLKQQTQELKQDYTRQGKFLLEQFQHRLSIVAEVQTDHSKKLDAILEMVAKNTEDIDIMKGMLRRKVDVEEFEALERRVGLLEKKLRLA